MLPDPYDARNKDHFHNDISLWPDVRWPDLFSYLIDSPGPYTRESLKTYRSLDAFNYYKSGKVHCVVVYKDQKRPKICVLLGNVSPGQKSGSPYKCWIIAEKEGTILSGHCQCMAGLGEVCSHVAAVLFFVEAAVREGRSHIAVTSKPCEWSKAGKNVTAAPVLNIDFSKPIRGRAEKEYSHESIPTARGSPRKLYSMVLEAFPEAKVLRHFPVGFIDPEETDSASEDDTELELLPSPILDLFDEKYKGLSTEELQQVLISVFDSLHVSEKQCHYLERVTREQSRTEIWKLHRRGRLTASYFHRVLTMKESTSPHSLVSDVMGYTEGFSGTAATVWGTKSEDEARKQFILLEQGLHKDFKCHKAGLVINTNWPHLGASPDGFTDCTCCGRAILEIKCPFSHKSSLMEKAITDPNFCLDEKRTLKKSHQYYTQIQGQLFVTGAAFCFFIVFLPKTITYQRIYPDKIFWEDTLKPKLDVFFVTHILPEILTLRLDKKDMHEGKEQLYCLCEQPAQGKMIACDSDTCKIVWFHFKCVNIIRKPNGKWFCCYCKSLKGKSCLKQKQ